MVRPKKIWSAVGQLALATLAVGLSGALSSNPLLYAQSSSTDASILANRSATGAAVRGLSPDVGVDGHGANFGVVGRQSGAEEGYGGYFTSEDGVGIFGRTFASPSTQNPDVPGVWGVSDHGVGVLGETLSAFGLGVYGRAATGVGVFGETGGSGVFGFGEAFGVQGWASAPEAGAGYGGYFSTDTGIGVYGETTAVPTTTNSLPAGVSGFSENGAGIFGSAGEFAWAGYFDGHVRIDGSLVVSDSIFAEDKSGYLFDVAWNADDEPLVRGDVVAVVGLAPESGGGALPVPAVRRVSEAVSGGVIGVADRRVVRTVNGRNRTEDGPVAPGELVGVVTVGAFAAVRADASFGAIRPGDLLVSSPTPGHAMRADRPPPGTVIGKALEPLDGGSGTIGVMVALQ